ncbi:hypothetical protein pb186bvf_010631 [Paramecium bursaria]
MNTPMLSFTSISQKRLSFKCHILNKQFLQVDSSSFTVLMNENPD